jgi:putative tryptophan/tyrosine transport system substrate-binding protein
VVNRRPTAIFAPSVTSASAAKAATQTIPIIFNVGADPVELGLVASLNRPGGNLTGVVGMVAEIATKRLELLHKAVPATQSIALLTGRADIPNSQVETRLMQSAARTLGLSYQRMARHRACASLCHPCRATNRRHRGGWFGDSFCQT